MRVAERNEMGMMDGEMSNFIMVWTMVGGTMCYCHAVGRSIGEGKGRLIAILPAVMVLLLLPLRLTSIHLGGPSSFFIGWLSTFKLLLFAFAKGPLSSNPPLSLSQFVPLACLPIKLHHPPNPTPTPVPQKGPNKSPLTYASTTMIIIFAALIPLYGKRESLNPKLVLFLYSLHMYIGLEFIYSTISMVTRKVLKVQLEPQFDEPYLSTSLQNFWGRRWNIMVNRVLHPTVYEPVANASTRLLGRKWAPLPAILATFSVSAIMHELVFYYIKRESRAWEPWEPSWDATCFFLLHGACLALEVAVKREFKGKTKWRVPRVVTWMLTVVFVIYTALSLFVPALVRCRVYEKATREIGAITEVGKQVYAVLRFGCFHLISRH